jgi:hypothetical protein
MSAENKIFLEGLLSGIISGITVTAAIGTDKSRIPVAIYQSFCEAAKNSQPNFNCSLFIIALAIISALLTLLTFLENLHRTDDKRHAALTYAVSYFIGLLITILFI